MSEPATAEKLDKETEAEEETKVASPGVNRFGLQAEKNQQWRLDVPHGTNPQQCYEPTFWSHIAMHLRPGDEIRVFPDDMAWELVLHTVEAGNSWANVQKKDFYEYATRGEMERVESRYAVIFAGTTHKWRVLMDGKKLKEGFETEAIARRWAANHSEATKR